MTLGENSNGKGTWILQVDGSSNFKGSGLELVLRSSNREKIKQSIRFGFQVTNNEAKNEAIIASLGLAKEMGVKKIQVHNDS